MCIRDRSYAGFVDGLQKQTEAVLYDRPRKADIAYFTGKMCIRDRFWYIAKVVGLMPCKIRATVCRVSVVPSAILPIRSRCV